MEKAKQIILGIIAVAGFILALVMEQLAPTWLIGVFGFILVGVMLAILSSEIKEVWQNNETEYTKQNDNKEE